MKHFSQAWNSLAKVAEKKEKTNFDEDGESEQF